MIEIRNLNKSFNKNHVLNNINLKINNKSIFGLIGINGAGKSTLLRLISGILKADSGQILIDNQDVYENEQIKSQLIFVGDELFYTRNSTIKQIKDFYESFYCINNDNYYKLLNLFKLDENANVNDFSKGMKRQIFLLISLSIMPKVLLLDEAFDGLDPLIRIQVKKIISDSIIESDSIIIISSHNLKDLEDICDSYAILNNNHILNSGNIIDKMAEINKYQIAFKDDIDISSCNSLDIIQINNQGKLKILVIRGESRLVEQQLMALNPIFMEKLPINFEELFLYQVEGELHDQK